MVCKQRRQAFNGEGVVFLKTIGEGAARNRGVRKASWRVPLKAHQEAAIPEVVTGVSSSGGDIRGQRQATASSSQIAQSTHTVKKGVCKEEEEQKRMRAQEKERIEKSSVRKNIDSEAECFLCPIEYRGDTESVTGNFLQPITSQSGQSEGRNGHSYAVGRPIIRDVIY